MKKISYVLLLFGLLAMSCKSESTPSETTDTTKQSADSKPLTSQETAEYVAKGKKIAKASFVVLSGQLKMAMAAGGPPKAVQFCSIQAVPIVDSLMVLHKANIRRTSDRLRSWANKPSANETAQLMAYKDQIAKNQALKPVVMPLKDGKIQFFAPIKMKAVCLKCHGTVGESMKEDHYKVIKELYPDDQAIGYKEGDFRGIWSIQFDR